jgi:hypothetical protein
MEVAKLVLEYLKAVAWPLIVLFLVLRFRLSILSILNAISSRLASAETVNVGVFGQEIQISGTAKELQRVGQELLAMSPGDQHAQAKASRILQAIPQLNDPMADIIGLALLNAPQKGLTSDELLEHVLNIFNPQKDRESMRAEQAQFLLLSMAREIEKVLAQLVELNFVAVVDERYSLTPSGRDFFQKVAVRQQHLLSHFVTKVSDKSDKP